MPEIVVDVPESVVVDNNVYAPATGVAHFNPVAVLLSAVNTWSLEPTASLATVSAAVAAMMSPLASTIVGLIAEAEPILLSIYV